MMNMSWKIPRKPLGIFLENHRKIEDTRGRFPKKNPENFRQSSENRRKPPEIPFKSLDFPGKFPENP